MQPPPLIAPLAAAAALLAAAPAARRGSAASRSRCSCPATRPPPAIRADAGAPGSSAPAPAPARAPWRARSARGRSAGGDYVVARARARAIAGALRSRGLLALRPAERAAPRPSRPSPTTRSRRRRTPGAPPSPTRTSRRRRSPPTSPLIALVDSRLDETHPEFAGGQRRARSAAARSTTCTAPRPPPSRPRPQNGVGIVGVWPGRPRAQRPAAARRADLLGLGAAASRARDPRRRRGDQHELRLAQPLLRRSTTRCSSPSARGIVPVAAAGNEFDRGQPARVPGLAAARAHGRGASTPAWTRSSFSNANAAIDLSAPGRVDHDRGAAGARRRRRRRTATSALDGTSFSAPMVAAAVAWVRAARPGARARPGRAGHAAVGARPRPQGLRQRHRLRRCSTSAPR